MPRQSAVKNYFTFVKGMITEATGLTFPENASSDEDNFDLFKNGSRKRRKGCDYESSYVLSSNISASYVSDRAISAHRWTSVAGLGTVNFLMVQVGPTLYFHDLNEDSFSSNTKSFTVDLNSFSAPTTIVVGEEPVRAVSGKGLLFVVGKGLEPFYIKYDPDTDTISTTQITLRIRDFERQEDDLDEDERPATLSDEHNYNLLNQGWSSTNISAFFSSQAVYPSNADVWYLGKDASDNFSATLLVKQGFGNTLAANGHYIVDAFNKARTGLDTEYEYERPQAVAFMAGRAFFSGVESKKLGNQIYFTQILEGERNIGRCYQEADPTAEHINELLPTDGGVIVVPEMGRVIAMTTVLNSLVVFAENGVWVITGSTGAGFFADDYMVQKISNVGILGAGSVVNVEGSALYWGRGGIYALVQDPTSGQLSAQNLTTDTIQTYYNSISEAAKIYAQGVYDEEQKKIYWAFNKDTAFAGGSFRNKYDRLLVLQTDVGAFYPLTIQELETDSPFVAAPIISLKLRRSTVTSNVVVSGDPVQVVGDQVTVDLPAYGTASALLKLLAMEPQSDGLNYKYTFAEFNNNSFLDWADSDGTGVDAPAYLETGYEIFGDAIRTKQVPYLYFMFQKTETGFVDDGSGNLIYENPSSLYVAARWDWSDHSNSGKWGTQFQAYRFRRAYVPTGAGDLFQDGTTIVQTKNRLRGTGHALQLRMDTEEGKDCHILGWTVVADQQGVP
jgi:hypothetical protein